MRCTGTRVPRNTGSPRFTGSHGAALLDRMVNRQAQIVAYADDYVMLIIAIVPAVLLLFVMRLPRKAVGSSGKG